jgi:hypothetical protein
MMNRTGWSGRASGWLLGVVLTASAGSALGQQAGGDDVVWLGNGGRLRGVVIENDPAHVVRMRLADGSVRELQPAEIARIEYAPVAAAPAPAAPLAPAAAEPTPPAAPPSYGTFAAPVVPAGRDEGARAGRGLMVGGIVLTSIGLAAVLGGAAGLVVLTETTEGDAIGKIENHPETWAAIGPMIGGGLFVLIGAPMWSVGANERRYGSAASAPRAAVAVSPFGADVTVAF